MDDAQVGELRRWAAGLAEDSRAEVRAAAKAIQLLSDDVLAARSQLLEERLIREALESRDVGEAGEPVEVAPHLLDRVRGLLRPRLG
jgi:hypothetical protein